MGDKYKVDYLNKSQHEEWNLFVDESPQGSIFCKSWWLDGVAEDRYRILGAFKQGRIVGGIPIVSKSRKIRSDCTMPEMTKYLGILLPNIKAKYSKKINEEMTISEKIVEALNEIHYFVQNFHYNYTNWLPFLWEGYKEITRYTYVLFDIQNHNDIRENFARSTKNSLKKANKNELEIVEDDLGLETFWNIWKMTFERQNMAAPISYEFLNKLDEKLLDADKRKIFYVLDTEGRIHSVNYLVWDNKSAYALMAGSDPEVRDSGAATLAIWEGIKYALKTGKYYDFTGSVVKNIEKYFRSFGCVQKRYFQIRKEMTNFMKIKASAKKFMYQIKSGN